MSDVISPVNNQKNDSSEQSAIPRPRLVLRAIGVVLIVLSVLLGWFLLVGYLGWQNGQAALLEARETKMTEQIARQIDLARTNIDQGSFNLADRRLEYVLELDPENQDARSLQQQAQAGVAALTTPQTVLTVTTTPTPEPFPTATPGLISDPESELGRLHRLAADQIWEELLPALIAFQRQFPNYERRETDQMLYEAYVNRGLLLLEGEDVERGLFYLEQAEKLGDLTQEILDYRLWAELYLQGIAFHGVNWGVSIYYFRELCLSAPFYQLACERLQESLVNYGDQYADSLDWCPAQEHYQEALEYDRTQDLVEKSRLAREECLLATPTPLAPITDTLPITGTGPILDSPFFLPTPTPGLGQ